MVDIIRIAHHRLVYCTPRSFTFQVFSKSIGNSGLGIKHVKELSAYRQEEHRFHPYRTYSMSERVHRSVMNMKVGMLFYLLSLFLSFFSRKIFLDCLGTEFIGLTSMLANIMNYLSVAELGIGTSIVYFLYKPLQEGNHMRINEIMSILAYLYRWIGYVIGIFGLITSLFFPLWFHGLGVGLPFVYFAFYSFLAASMIGYLINFRQLLVSADQKQYIVNAYFQSISLTQNIIQILLAYYYKNIYLWVVAGLLFTLIGCILFNLHIRKIYPWLKIDIRTGREKLKEYPDILKKTKQVFIHKIKSLILYHSDDILVGAFISIVQVAYFGNYTMITNKLNYLVNILSDGMNSGIGNLIAEGNKQNTMKVFWELTAIRFLILGVVIFPLLLFFQSFISLWLGNEYCLNDIIVYLLIFNIFINLSRGVVEMYISAHGLFSDVWTAWTELLLNITLTLCMAPFLGIIGILSAKILSVFFIAFLWKPFFLFSKGFQLPVSIYWKGMIPFYLIFILFVGVNIAVKEIIIDSITTSLLKFIIYGVAIIVPLLMFYFLTLLYTTKGMKYFAARNPYFYKHIAKYIK